jgi:bifunctional non-homologous end joining protein LigD
MLSRPGPLPSGASWSFELKWDGFRAIVSTEDGLRVRSRRGWNMTTVLPELRGLPSGLVLDGELVAWKGSEPYFPHICRRVLNRDMSVPMTFVVFDVLQRDGVDFTRQPYLERRQELEASAWTAQPGRHASGSTTDGRSSPRCASSASRASWRRATRVSTGRTIAAG